MKGTKYYANGLLMNLCSNMDATEFYKDCYQKDEILNRSLFLFLFYSYVLPLIRLSIHLTHFDVSQASEKLPEQKLHNF